MVSIDLPDFNQNIHVFSKTQLTAWGTQNPFYPSHFRLLKEDNDFKVSKQEKSKQKAAQILKTISWRDIE